MDLFHQSSIGPSNLLPQDGEAFYLGSVFSFQQASEYLSLLFKEIDWRHDEVMIMGKRITTKRKVAWYGDRQFAYTYSNSTKRALPWTSTLLEIKNTVESISKENYNSCLLNYYSNGDEGMSWHSDDEKMLKKHGAIASVSFGSERKFSFKHKTDNLSSSIILQNGSLLLMKGAIQDYWKHALPKTKKSKTPRVNLTFRTILD